MGLSPSSLPSDTLVHLQAFLAERREREDRFRALAEKAEREQAVRVTESEKVRRQGDGGEGDNGLPLASQEIDFSMDLFEEDWQMSQFWYDLATQQALAEEVSFADLGFCTHPLPEPELKIINVAIVSAPSVFVHLLRLQHQNIVPPNIHPVLLEYDSRFAVLCNPGSTARFFPYDFNHPLQLPANLQGTFDAVLVDPPFLSAECQAGAAVTVRWLLKHVSEEDTLPLKKGVGRRVVVCTGERVTGFVERYYAKEGVKETDWEVRHERGLGNEFRCFASYESARWRWANKTVLAVERDK